MPKRLPRKFPHQLCFVPGWATPFTVPRYISRCDIDEPGSGTHGWQVRYNRQGGKFFGDSTGRKRRSPKQSLAEAIQYLAEIYEGPRNRLRDVPTKRRQSNEISEPGIRMVQKSRRGWNGTKEIYIEAMSPERGGVPKRVYAETTNTVTPERLETAKQKALEYRRKMETEHLAAQCEHPRKGDIN